MYNKRTGALKTRSVLSRITTILLVVTLAVMVWGGWNMLTHIERYSPTALKELRLLVESGDQTAIDYYQSTYLDNGEILF